MIDYSLGEYQSPARYEAPVSVVSGVSRSLAGKAVLEDYIFPLSVDAGVSYSIRLLVHNVGTDGLIAGGIVNNTGNPGSFTIISDGVETVVSPGQYFRAFTNSPVPNCTTIDIVRSIRFSVAGTYTIRLWAMHEDTGSWYYDQEVPLVVSVGQAAGIIKQVHVLDQVKLKAEAWEIVKTITRVVANVDSNVLIGGKLDYVISYTRGNEPITTARLFWNDINYVDKNLTIGQNITGTIDLTGLIFTSNSLMAQIESAPLFWAELSFDVWLTLEFSAPPTTDPTTPFNWDEIISKYGPWIALGVTGVVVLSLMRPRGAPIIVIPRTGGK